MGNYKRLCLFLIIPAVLISGIGIASITSNLSVEHDANIISDSLDGGIKSPAPRIATAEQTLHYYYDQIQDFAPVVYYTSAVDYQELQVRFSLAGTSIVTGARYRHYDSDSGPFDIDLTFGGDSASVSSTDLNVPAASGVWRNFSYLGPTYVIDDDPYITFASNDPYSNCMEMCRDDDAAGGHSYYDNGGGSWVLSTASEYVVEIEYETIQTLVKDVGQSGSISGADYVDAYYATLTGGKAYEFTLTRTSGTGNLNLRLVNYVNHGTTGTSVNSTSGSSYPEKMRYAPSGSTTYMLLVEPASTSDTAVYSIVFTEIAAPSDDIYEENDGFGSAYTLGTGSYPSLVCADDDYYKIYVTAGNTVTAYISFTNSLGDLDLKLYNPSQAQINSSTSTNDWERVSYAVSVTGYYYVYVYRYSGTGSNTYAMTLSITGSGGDDAYEENDVFGSAYTLGTGSYPSLVCADDDWYKIYVTAGNIVSAYISFTNSLGNLDLKLYNSGSVQINSSTTTNNWEQASYAVTATGYYYVQVYRFSGTGSNNYAMTLSITSGSGGDDIYEENDVLGDAESLAVGIYSSLVCADDDWFRISVSAGITLVVTVTPAPAGDNLDLKITYSSGTTAANGAISAGSNIASFDVTTMGTYYIKVSKAGAANTYQMIIATSTTIKPSGIAGFDVFMLLGALSLVITLMLRKKLKHPE